MTSHPRPGRRWRIRLLVGATAVLLLGAAVAATAGLGGAGPPDPPPTRTGPGATTLITRETLVESVTLTGALGYGAAVPLGSAAEGTVTYLPDVGVTIRPGGVLFRVDQKPVVLLAGALPMYRALAEGTTGPDVRQFKQNLVDLKVAKLTVDDRFTPATTAATKRWQKTLGQPDTGIVEMSSVVFLPGPVRIDQQLVRLGRPASGDILTYTGGTKVVTVSASAGETTWAVPATKVAIVLPGGDTVAGTVEKVSNDATAGTPKDADPASSGVGNAQVVVTIAVADQPALAAFESSPVDVRYVVRQREDVLTVPVSALLALAEGGYGVEVVDHAGTRIVTVQTGLFADGRVEISGPDLAEGMSVGIPQ